MHHPCSTFPRTVREPIAALPPRARDIRTAESVTEGHPDKVADGIADAILDAHLAQDPHARVAVEVLVKDDLAFVAGEVTSQASVDLRAVVRQTVRDIGYDDPSETFHADGLRVRTQLSAQAGEIAAGVTGRAVQGAGDQGLMTGYATTETAALMPLPIVLAHAVTRQLAADRRAGVVPWLRPDGKAQVSVRHHDGQPVEVTHVVVSAQHCADAPRAAIEAYVRDSLLPAALGDWFTREVRLSINPAGSFVQGGPAADCGVTGRKIIVDTYGGAARHGGGAFSGKDPSKVDRSAAYFCRWAARQVMRKGLAERVEVDVAYAIGVAEPVALRVYTFGTGVPLEAARLVESFDWTPAAIIRKLDLLRPIYRGTTNYGHFGRAGLPWEM
jgi:S-adenosylmethionine synthetase